MVKKISSLNNENVISAGENKAEDAESLIVIVTYNSRNFITECLQSVFASGYKDWKMVLIDNNSIDDTVKKVYEFLGENNSLRQGSVSSGFLKHGDVTVKSMRRNIGFAAAVNHAVFNLSLDKKAGKKRGFISVHEQNLYKYLILINPDVVLEKNALENLIYTLNCQPSEHYTGSSFIKKARYIINPGNKPYINNQKTVKAGAAGGLIYDYDGSGIQNAGGAVRCNFLTYHLNEIPGDLKVYPVDYASGAVFVTDLCLFKKIGGFDSGYRPLYFEELDYCLKIRKKGLLSLINTEVRAKHFEAASVDKFSSRFYRHYHKNRIRCAVINSGIAYFFKSFLPCEYRWFLNICCDERKAAKQHTNSGNKVIFQRNIILSAYFLNFLFLPYNLCVKLRNCIKLGKI